MERGKIMSIPNVLSKIVKFIPKTEGSAARITLNKTQLNLLTARNQEAGKILQEVLKGVKNPKIDVAYKAKSNYAIAGMRLRDGNKVVGQGAVSLTNPGAADGVIKYHVSAQNGERLFARGFLDAGKPVDTQNVAMAMSRQNGMMGGKLKIGETAGHEIQFREQDLVDLAKLTGEDKFLIEYTRGNRNLQRSLDRSMVDIRNTLRGNPTATAARAVPNNFHTAAKFDEKLITELEQLNKTDKVAFTKLKEELSKNGVQVYFHPKTGKLGVMEAANLDEVAKKLKSINA